MSVTLNTALNGGMRKINIPASEINTLQNNNAAFNEKAENNTSKNFDRIDFTHKSPEATGIYIKKGVISSSDNEKYISTAAINKVQTSSTSSGVYMDVIVQRAAKKASVSLSSSGKPNINSGWESNAYYGEINRIKGAFWCQTGGWSNLPDGGQCARTAAATMASINSGYTVTPNDTTGDLSGLTAVSVNRTTINYDYNASTYSISEGPVQGLKLYNCGSKEGTIAAINNELKNGRSVLVKTTVSGEHWVTVTGTLDGKPASQFSDFVGVDPWYNGSNPNNPSQGTGSGATNPNRAGVIQLSDVTNQNLHSSYRIITYKPGTEAAF